MSQSWTVEKSGIVRDASGVAFVLPTSVLAKFFSVVDYLAPLLRDNSVRTKVPASTIAGIIWAETGFLGATGGHSDAAVSPAGAVGRMQLMPFWFSSPTAIGDGRAHSREEMIHDDALNMRFGTDLLRLISLDAGDNLPAIASIYNCGATGAGHPWRPKTMTSNHFGICAEGNYIETVVAASNTYLQKHPRASASTPMASRTFWALGAGALGVLVVDRVFR